MRLMVAESRRSAMARASEREGRGAERTRWTAVSMVAPERAGDARPDVRRALQMAGGGGAAHTRTLTRDGTEHGLIWGQRSVTSAPPRTGRCGPMVPGLDTRGEE